MTHSPVDSRPPYIDPRDAVELTSQIIQLCPLLETLALPHTEMQLTINHNGLTVHPGVSMLTYERLVGARNLVSLTTDRRVLNSAALQLVGKLPRLKRLNLRTCLQTNATIFTLDPSLNSFPDLFPALEYLYVDYTNISEIREIWSIKPLVRRLTTVDIHLNPFVYDEYGSPYVFLDIVRGSPHIHTLIIKRPVTIYMVPEKLAPLSLLSLRSLSLSGLLLGPPATFCQDMGEALPLLRRLRLVGWVMDFWQLLWFSKFPQLDNLDIRIDWQSVQPENPCPEEPIQPSETLRTLLCNPPPLSVYSDNSIIQDCYSSC
ncbi:hypothetical protein BDV93DRAFT_566872 [Ceratobasidium sp. AG-I]|nr:hypothetical protein BDV93DRAFT_566872 [Ceratobasidium sp. AG-I]